jgi:hypothetical protein
MSNADDIALFYAAANAVEAAAADGAGMHADDVTLVNSLRSFAHDLEAGRSIPNHVQQVETARMLIEILKEKS